jgi:uncharacterized membrane protein YagU involved in acid resistance
MKKQIDHSLVSAEKGFLATIPLTLVMLATKKLTTGSFRPLPPDKVTHGVLKKIDQDDLSRNQFEWVMWASHFAFGAGAGSLWPMFSKATKPIPRPLRGPLYGLTVWLISYEVILPALNIVTRTTKAPRHRNLEVALSHLLWGYLVAKRYNK